MIESIIAIVVAFLSAAGLPIGADPSLPELPEPPVSGEEPLICTPHIYVQEQPVPPEVCVPWPF